MVDNHDPELAGNCGVADKHAPQVTNDHGLLQVGNHVFEGAGSHVVVVVRHSSRLCAGHEEMAIVEGTRLLQGPLAPRADQDVAVRVRN